MTYCTWLLEHWELSAKYKWALAAVVSAKERIETVKQGIERAERDEIPDESHWLFKDHRNTFSVFDTTALMDRVIESSFDLPAGKLQQDRWEKEALEAEDKRRENIQRWLSVYRDGKPLFDLGDRKSEKDSLPELTKTLPLLERQLAECRPEPVHDWRTPDTGDWYENSQRVLNEMLGLLEWRSGYDFDDSMLNVISDLTMQYRGFRFAHWLTEDGYCTCCVSNVHVHNQKIVIRDCDFWAATLLALLEFIDVHWEPLLVESERQSAILKDVLNRIKAARTPQEDK